MELWDGKCGIHGFLILFLSFYCLCFFITIVGGFVSCFILSFPGQIIQLDEYIFQMD